MPLWTPRTGSHRTRSASPVETLSTERPARPAPPATTSRRTSSATTRATSSATTGRTLTASNLHAFNRFEIKYLVSEQQVGALRDALRAHMDDDAYSGENGYPITSVYYDTPTLTFYWQKIEGLKFRRKLRLRVYGDADALTGLSPVFVEIKQRVNRITQKRRIELPYQDAIRLCSSHGYEPAGEVSRRERALIDEVGTLVGELDLRPTVTTAYHRQAWVGRDADLGLRVTLDHRLRGRDRDFHLGADSENRLTLPPRLRVLEIKANERVPSWVTDLTARMNLDVVRISKYCQTVQAFRLAPRSLMHAPDELDELWGDATGPSLPTHHDDAALADAVLSESLTLR